MQTITFAKPVVASPRPVTALEQKTLDLPKDRLKGLKENWKHDLVSGFILSLIALPLSLAIAMAAGAPPMAGLFAAIIGGMVVSQLSGSHVTINGPAAGLIVVILNAVEKLGGGVEGYHCALAAITVSGIALFILGKLRAGVLGYMVPATVVHGMLTALGLVIIAKELPVFLGVSTTVKEPLMLFASLPAMLEDLNPKIAAIGAAALCILFAHSFVKNTIIKKIPAPLLVVIAGIGLGLFFNIQQSHHYVFAGHDFAIDPQKALVVLHPHLHKAIAFPDWSKCGTEIFWNSTIAIILIQGVETLLSCSAVDKLDPYGRRSDLSRDMAAVGVGTAISGLIGGIPMITEIVRSTANVANGARTRWSNFFHGTFILLAVLIGVHVINMIPQAALASLLIMVGFRLAAPNVFKHVWKIGPDQLLIFCVTIVAVLATDLLVGVGVGIACTMLLHLFDGAEISSNLFFVRVLNKDLGDDGYLFSVEGVVIFSNYLSLRSKLNKVPVGRKLILDLSKARLIDHTAMDHLMQFKRDFESSGRDIEITGLGKHKTHSSHPLATHKLCSKSAVKLAVPQSRTFGARKSINF